MKKVLLLFCIISIFTLFSCNKNEITQVNKNNDIIVKNNIPNNKEKENVIPKKKLIKDCIVEYKPLAPFEGKKIGEKIIFNFGKIENCNDGKKIIEAKLWSKNDKEYDPNSQIKDSSIILDDKKLIIKNDEKILIGSWGQIQNEIDNKEFKIKTGEKLKSSLLATYKEGDMLTEEDIKKYEVESNIDKFYITISIGRYNIVIPLKNLKKYNDAKKIFEKNIELFKNISIIKEDKVVKKQVDNGKFSDNNLLLNGYKLNNLGKIKEFYQTTILDENNGYYRNQTIYKEGNKILSFGLIYAHGVELEISYPIKKTIDLGMYDNSYPSKIGQPIFGKFDYKVIITNLNTIKLVNNKKGINKVLWNN